MLNLYSVNVVNKMLWVGVVNQGTYASVTDLHNNVHRRQHYHSRCKPWMDIEKPTIQLVYQMVD